MSRRLGLVLAALGGAGLAGCGLIGDYQRPPVDLPQAYPGGGTATEAARFAQVPWREVYTDPALAALIEEALSHGPDALLAAAREREAAAAIGVSRAQQLPHAGLQLQTTPINRIGDQRLSSSFLGAVGASWEIDLWGRYSRATEAARADWLASEANRRGVTTVLIANVANLYYTLAALQASARVTESVAELQREGLRLIRETSAAGINSAAEERQQESALAATEANLPPLRQRIVETGTALAVLVGRRPGTLELAPDAARDLPGALPAGLPSELLERRPDILVAEAQLHAAHARLSVAKAMFFPDISLTGAFGVASTSLSSVLNGSAAPVASLGPNVLAPLFQGGALIANRDIALARLDQALVSYQKTINAAFGEVANDLSGYQTSADLVAIEARRVAAAREALRLAELRFRAGITGFLELLDAQRQQLASETDAINAELTHRQALINLYLALGGGWSATADPATPAAGGG